MDSTDKEDFLESYNNGDDYNDLLFYTPKIVQYIDDMEIMGEILLRWPALKETSEQKLEKEERRALAEFLQQRTIVNEILNKYNLTIIDMMKLFYRKSPHIFNTVTYSNKLKKIIEANGYRTELEH